MVGFALETKDLEAYASKKLTAKNLDLVVANSAVEPGSGFGGGLCSSSGFGFGSSALSDSTFALGGGLLSLLHRLRPINVTGVSDPSQVQATMRS